jgi:hypothetical protein
MIDESYLWHDSIITAGNHQKTPHMVYTIGAPKHPTTIEKPSCPNLNLIDTHSSITKDHIFIF